MPDDAPAPPSYPLPPRPGPPSSASAFVDRLRRGRDDPRVAAVLLLTVACAAGVFWFRSGISSASPGPTATARARSAPATTVPGAPTSSTTGAPTSVVVHVAGAVAKPGVVTLPAARRVVDAIAAAGGPLPDADLDRLNLAAPLTDGVRIAVPKRGEPAPALEPGAVPGPAGATTAGATATGPINLNAATQAELETLPGIGPTLAQAIIAERERAGGFRSVEDLRRVRGIGDARFAQVQALVTV